MSMRDWVGLGVALGLGEVVGVLESVLALALLDAVAAAVGAESAEPPRTNHTPTPAARAMATMAKPAKKAWEFLACEVEGEPV